MAITKMGVYRNPPEDITDYEAIVAHLEAYTRQIGNQGMILTEWTNTTTAPKIAMGSYISHGGVLYVVEDEDYSLPALSVNGTYYIRVAVSGATLVITYTTNIADYSWNAVYGGLYHADESQVLGYQIIKAGVAVGKYKILNPWQGSSDFTVVDYLGHLHGTSLGISGAATIGGALGVTGAISGAEITAQNKAVLRGRDMTYGFISNTKILLPSQIKSQALAMQDDGLYTYELADGVVYRRNPNFGSVVDSLDLQGSYGMTWIDGKLITCSLSTVYVYNGYSASLITSFAPPDVNRCGALGVKDGNLLTISYGSKTIYVHDGISATVVETIHLGNINSAYSYANLSGVVWTGENFIISLGGQTGVGPGQLVAISKNNDDAYDIENVHYISTTNRICGLTKLPSSNRLFFTSYSASEAYSNIMDILIGIK